jgi:hypothetical protein
VVFWLLLGLSNDGFVGVWVVKSWFGCCLGRQTMVLSVFGSPGSGFLVAAWVVKRWFCRCLGRQAVVWLLLGLSNVGFVGVWVVKTMVFVGVWVVKSWFC